MAELFSFSQHHTLVIVFMIFASWKASTIALNQSRFRGFVCNFNQNWCGWRNAFRTDDFNWKRGRGSAGQQRGSGTSDDHGGGGGYVYIRSRSKGNRTARVYSGKINITEDACFRFWYFMKGRTLGHLEVLFGHLSSDGQKKGETLLWNLRGHQGNQWKLANIPINAGTVGFFIIEAFDWERGKSGNILIDDTNIIAKTASCANLIPRYAEPSIIDKVTSTAVSSIASSSRMPNTLTNPILKTLASIIKTTMSSHVINTKSTVNELTRIGTSATPQFFTQNSSVSADVPTILPNFGNKNKSTSNVLTVSTNIQLSGRITASTSQTKSVTDQTVENINSPSTASSTVGIVVGVVSVTVLIILVVVLVIYLRKRKQRLFEKNCSVVMTRMYPDITVNTNISFQKLS